MVKIVRRHKPTGPTEKKQLEEEWQALEEARSRIEAERQRLAEGWPEDVTKPFKLVPILDWSQQPPLPAERIDWSQHGAPLRVKPTFGTIVTMLSILISILGAGAYFYWGVRTHIQSSALHLTPDGVGWGVPMKFETRTEAKEGRMMILREVQKLRADQQVMFEDTRRELRDAVKKLKRR